MARQGAGFEARVQRLWCSQDVAVVLEEDADQKQGAATGIQRGQTGGNQQVRGPY